MKNEKKRKSKKMTEKMPPSKKINKKGGKKYAGNRYPLAVEEEEYMQAKMDNHPMKKAADIGQAMMRAKMGYSKKPRVKPSTVKGK